MKISRIQLVGVLAIGVAIAGAGLLFSSNQETEIMMAVTKTFQIGLREDGEFVSLGVLTFDDVNAGALSGVQSGPQADRLAEALASIADKDVLSIEKSEPYVTSDGENVMGYFSVDVERSSDDFPDAVLRYLSKQYGFDNVPTEATE
jgi:hypothetical protein